MGGAREELICAGGGEGSGFAGGGRGGTGVVVWWERVAVEGFVWCEAGCAGCGEVVFEGWDRPERVEERGI